LMPLSPISPLQRAAFFSLPIRSVSQFCDFFPGIVDKIFMVIF
jgi:hypothetical protein